MNKFATFRVQIKLRVETLIALSVLEKSRLAVQGCQNWH